MGVMKRWLQFSGLCCLLALPVSTAAVAAVSSPTPSYVQFCSQYQSMSPDQFAAAEQRDSDFENRLPDPDVVAAVKSHLTTPVNVSVAIRQFNSMTGDRNGQKTAVAQIQQAQQLRYVVVAFSRSNQFASIKAISDDTVTRYYGFARGMAAYMLLNDLMASDTTVPRLGCSRAADIQFYAMPGVLSEIQRAFMTTPEQDPTTLASAAAAYRSFATSKEARSNPRTLDTVRRLGDSPTITLVYRDAAGQGPSAYEFDVVRISSGTVRTYAELNVAGGTPRMSSPGLCVVGDTRCADYYVWP